MRPKIVAGLLTVVITISFIQSINITLCEATDIEKLPYKQEIRIPKVVK